MQLVVNEDACWRNSRVIEALSIQVPERLNLELFAPPLPGFELVREAFIESIIWRRPSACRRDETLDYVREQIVHDPWTHRSFLETLVAVAPNPEHPCNADSLHENLIEYELPDRYTFWSIFLHERGMVEGLIRRLIMWAWSDRDRSSV